MQYLTRFAISIIVITLALSCIGLYLHPGVGYSWVSYFDHWLSSIVQFSIIQALLSASLAIFLSIPFAWILAQRTFKGQWFIKGVLNLFFIMPVLTVILGVVAAFSGWLNIFSLKGILLAHLYLNAPYAIRVLWERLERISDSQRNLAVTLGFTAWNTFRWLELPVIWQAIKPIFVVIFLLCFSSFTVVLTLGGGPANTNLEVAIYQALKFDFDPKAAVLYALIHAIIALSVMLLFGRRSSFSLELQRNEQQFKKFMNVSQGIGALVLLGILFYPLISLITQAFSMSWIGSDRLGIAIFTSVKLAFFSSVFALALALSRSLSLDDRRLVRILDFGLLVMPIMVVTTGLFLLALKFELAFKLTELLIVLINGLMAMPILVFPLQSRITVFRSRYERVAMVLGMDQMTQWQYIYWPALKTILPWSFALSAVLSIGDMGIAALIGSANFVTLPLLIYQAMGSYQMVLASQLTLLLLAFCFLILLFAEGLGSRSKHA